MVTSSHVVKKREADVKRMQWMSLWLRLLLAIPPLALAADYPTSFTNQNSVANTRHNMMQNAAVGMAMVTSRNRYGGVCIYCHTPHGANAGAQTPLWNRLLPAANSYTTYSALNTSSMTQTVYNPGGASLPCLSCHDGSQAVDAIINMPGSGNYSATADPGSYVPGQIVNTWDGTAKSNLHLGLAYRKNSSGVVTTGEAVGCMACHTGPSGSEVATDFSVFMIGKDLRNDHPIGVIYPTTNGPGTDWNTPGGSKVVGTLTNKYFDDGPTNSRMDKTEIRLYDTGNGAAVECASCHDPHGVPSGAAGSEFIPSFLRKSINGSTVCMTCHAK